MPARRTSTRTTATRTRRASSVCLVKVAKTGGAVQEFSLEANRTVAGALELAGVSHGEGSRIKVNGKNATASTKLKNGDIVTIAGDIKGGL